MTGQGGVPEVGVPAWGLEVGRERPAVADTQGTRPVDLRVVGLRLEFCRTGTESEITQSTLLKGESGKVLLPELYHNNNGTTSIFNRKNYLCSSDECY